MARNADWRAASSSISRPRFGGGHGGFSKLRTFAKARTPWLIGSAFDNCQSGARARALSLITANFEFLPSVREVTNAKISNSQHGDRREIPCAQVVRARMSRPPDANARQVPRCWYPCRARQRVGADRRAQFAEDLFNLAVDWMRSIYGGMKWFC